MNSKEQNSGKARGPDRSVRPGKTVHHFLQALRLACVHIWRVSPTVSLAFLVLMTLQGIGPLATVWAGKLLLDAILAALSTQGSPAAIRGVMVALAPPTVNYVPLEEATRRMKSVPLDSDIILTARDLGICFGD